MKRSAPPSYYDVLGVSPNATSDEIDEAWKRLVREHHPDRTPPDHRDEANARTAAINEAHDKLRDPAQRARYDRLLVGSAVRPRVRMNADEALEALVRLRRARRVERLRIAGAGAAGLAAILYTARALRLLG